MTEDNQQTSPAAATTTTEIAAPITPPDTTGAVVLIGPNIKRNLPLYYFGHHHSSSSKLIDHFRRFGLGKKCWRSVNALIYDDSAVKVFSAAADDGGSAKKSLLLQFRLDESSALTIAFGRKAAALYGAPPINEEERNFVSPNNFFALQQSSTFAEAGTGTGTGANNKEAKLEKPGATDEKVHWFAAKDQADWINLMDAAAECLEGKANPPQMGRGAQLRYRPDDQRKWKTYWLHQQQSADANAFELAAAAENGVGGTGNGTGNGASSAEASKKSPLVPTPLVAVLKREKAEKAAAAEAEAEKVAEAEKAEAEEKKKKQEEAKQEEVEKSTEKKAAEAESAESELADKQPESPSKKKISSPTINLKSISFKKFLPHRNQQHQKESSSQKEPPRDYYKIDEAAESAEAGILNFESETGLSSSQIAEGAEAEPEKTIVVRLVNGKRVKEIITRNTTNQPAADHQQPEQEKQQETPPPPNSPPPPTPPPSLEEAAEPKSKPAELQQEPVLQILTKQESSLNDGNQIDTIDQQIDQAAPPVEIKEEEIFTSHHTTSVNTTNLECTIQSHQITNGEAANGQIIIAKESASFQQNLNQ